MINKVMLDNKELLNSINRVEFNSSSVETDGLDDMISLNNKMETELEIRIIEAYLAKEIDLLEKEMALLAVSLFFKQVPSVLLELTIDDVYNTIIKAGKTMLAIGKEQVVITEEDLDVMVDKVKQRREVLV